MDLKKRVAEINKSLFLKGLVIQTWGNASAVDRINGRIYIKSSGVPFENLTQEDISEVGFDGLIYSSYNPSVDTPTHIELYKGFKEIGGIVHTHSHYATVFAQAGIPIPCFGTTHADYFKGDIPVLPYLSQEEIGENYELNTGKKIIEYFKDMKISPIEMPVILLPNHGIFVWGESIERALEYALVVEAVAKLAYETASLSNIFGGKPKIHHGLIEKHFSRKHGDNKYYGQK